MRPALRVAVVARSVFPLHGLGGLERHVYDLVRYLADAGVETTLITRPPKTSTGAEPIHPRITLRTVPYRTFPLAGRRGTTVIDRSTAYPLFGLRAGRLAWELVRDGKIDLVHGLGASVLGYARRRATSARRSCSTRRASRSSARPTRAARGSSAPAICRCGARCSSARGPPIASSRPIARSSRSCASISACPRSASASSRTRSTCAGSTASRRPADGARVRLAAGIGRDEVVLLSVGRLEENKGFHHLAAALGALAAHGGRLPEGRWRWVVIGEGPFRGRLEQAIRAANLGARGNARRPRRRRGAARVVRGGDALRAPDALRGQLARDARSHGAPPRRRRDQRRRPAGQGEPGVNGWLVEPGDPSALAAAISGALDEPERLAAFGQAGRRIVEGEFSWDAAGRATLSLYKELLA